jgi:type IX secretion system PorP/SprF family membrane protein
MMKKIISILFLFINFGLYSQDFTFSQFYEQPLLRNPSLAGIFNGDLRIAMQYRDQWGAITVPFRTSSLSIEHKTSIGKGNDFITIGSQMSVDGAGDIRLKRTQILPALNYHKSLSGNKDSYLSLAFMGGPVFSQFDPTQIKFGDQYQAGGYSSSNPTMQVLSGSGYNYWDLSTGISYTTVFGTALRMYVAGGISHINKPVIKSLATTINDAILPRYNFNLGINGKINDRDYITAFADYISQNGNRQIIGGVLYGFSTTTNYNDEEPNIFYVGSFLRWGDALIPVIKLSFNHMKIGLSYDVNVSSLKTSSNWRGGLEISMSYTNFLKIRNSSLDKVRCIRF